MTQCVKEVGLYVRNQDEALAFYVEKLGFRVHTDVRNGDYRWLTVQHPDQPSLQLGLFKPGPPVLDEATAQTLHAIVAKGAMPPLVLAVGRLIEKKGFADLVRACELVRRRGRSFRCSIVGKGPLEGELKALVRELGLEDVVELTGPRPREQLLGLYRRASVFAAPCVVGSDG